MNISQNQLFLNRLKKILPNELLSNKELKNVIAASDIAMIKNKKCKVCNKKYSGNNRFYGSSCVNNLYHIADIDNIKEIEDKELFLHSAIILKIHKTDVSKENLNDVCDSYLSKKYFEKIEEPRLKIIKKKLDICLNENKRPIMKLNTAYRVSNILKRNKKVLNDLSNADFDKQLDDNIVKFLKTYFSLNKISNPIYYEICYYMQLIVWEFVINSGKLKKLDFSSRCLAHSLSIIGEKPKDVIYTNKDKSLINKIKEDLELKERIQKIIKKYQKNGELFFNTNSKNNKRDSIYSFENGDLFYSLHSVTISLTGIKELDKWNLKIKLTDRYDFTEVLSNDKYTKKNKKYLTLGNMLNDMGTISTSYGVLKPYNITIKFNWDDFSE